MLNAFLLSMILNIKIMLLVYVFCQKDSVSHMLAHMGYCCKPHHYISLLKIRDKAIDMKKLLPSILLFIPLFVFANMQTFELKDVAATQVSMVYADTENKGNRAVDSAALAETAALNATQYNQSDKKQVTQDASSVSLTVALPLLAVAIGLFGLGANRRRV